MISLVRQVRSPGRTGDICQPWTCSQMNVSIRKPSCLGSRTRLALRTVSPFEHVHGSKGERFPIGIGNTRVKAKGLERGEVDTPVHFLRQIV